jgi:hypothetical protein
MPTRSRSHPARRPALPDEELEPEPGQSRLPLVLSVVALVAAGLALLWSTMFSGGAAAAADDCQARAWDSIPAATDLPNGWSVETSNFFSNNLSVTLAGPPAADESGQGAIYATVTCYGRDGAEALARSRAAEAGSSGTTNDLTDIGEAGYTVGDELSGLSTVHFRRGDLVGYVVVAGPVSPDELTTTAQAFDRAIQGARAGEVPSPAPARSAPAATLEPEPSVDVSARPPSSSPDASAAAPELEGLLPTEVDGTEFLVDSATGADILQDDPGSRAMTAALRALGNTPADLQVAQAYDEADELDLYFVAFSLPGADPDAFRTLILQSWLVSDAEGVTVEDVELAGKTLTRVDYGDDLPDAYLYSTGTAVILMHTSSAELAESAAEALP